MTAKHIIFTLIAAALLVAGIEWFSMPPKAPEHKHTFGKWSDPQEMLFEPWWNRGKAQYRQCSKCGLAERRKI